MTLPRLYTVRSLKGTHFTGALAQNAKEDESFDLPGGLKRVRITGVTLLSDQNLDWDIVQFRTSGTDDADADLDTQIDWVSFAVADGNQIAGAGLFRYGVTGLSLDLDNDDGKLHVGLVNRNSTAKIAGATGEVVIEFQMEV